MTVLLTNAALSWLGSLLWRSPGLHPAWGTHVAFVDGRGTAAGRQAYALHLRRCSRCRATHQALRDGLDAVASLAPASPPADGWACLIARLEAEAPTIAVGEATITRGDMRMMAGSGTVSRTADPRADPERSRARGGRPGLRRRDDSGAC